MPARDEGPLIPAVARTMTVAVAPTATTRATASTAHAQGAGPV